MCLCGRKSGHHRACPWGIALRIRCPDCRSLNRDGRVRHANHCKLKEYQP
jgi:hypothetical protein